MTLGEAKVGSTVVVTKIEGDGAYKRRIMDMGITKGSELYIRKVAPLGDPVEITVRGYELIRQKRRCSVRTGKINCSSITFVQEGSKERVRRKKMAIKNCTCRKPELW